MGTAKKHGPCGECAYFHILSARGRPNLQRGTCHGQPKPPMGWVFVGAEEAGCAVFEPAAAAAKKPAAEAAA